MYSLFFVYHILSVSYFYYIVIIIITFFCNKKMCVFSKHFITCKFPSMLIIIENSNSEFSLPDNVLQFLKQNRKELLEIYNEMSPTIIYNNYITYDML